MKKIMFLLGCSCLYIGLYAQNKKPAFINAANNNIQYIGHFNFTIKKQPVFMYSSSEVHARWGVVNA